MMLYELERGSMFTLNEPNIGIDSVFMLDHIDGMYSVCYGMSDGDLVHIAATTKVEPYGDE